MTQQGGPDFGAVFNSISVVPRVSNEGIEAFRDIAADQAKIANFVAEDPPRAMEFLQGLAAVGALDLIKPVLLEEQTVWAMARAKRMPEFLDVIQAFPNKDRAEILSAPAIMEKLVIGGQGEKVLGVLSEMEPDLRTDVFANSKGVATMIVYGLGDQVLDKIENLGSPDRQARALLGWGTATALGGRIDEGERMLKIMRGLNDRQKADIFAIPGIMDSIHSQHLRVVMDMISNMQDPNAQKKALGDQRSLHCLCRRFPEEVMELCETLNVPKPKIRPQAATHSFG